VGGSGGSAGWPEPGCRCASCRGQDAAGNARKPSAIVVDGVLSLGAGAPPASAGSAAAEGYTVLALGAAGWDITGPDGRRLLYPAGPGAVPAPPEGAAPYDIAFLDLLGDPTQLGWLRARGLVTPQTIVVLAFADHRVPGEAELARRAGLWAAGLAGDGDVMIAARSAPPVRPEGHGPFRVLVLGGARSGKSERAELRLAAEPEVIYVATGSTGADDSDWAARVTAHRARRPAWWRTVETTDLAAVLDGARGAVLIDGIGGWLAAVLDGCGAWDGTPGAPEAVAARITELMSAWRRSAARVVAVSDETGLGVVPATPAGRLFRDELGRLNQQLAAASEMTELVIAGRIMPLDAW
jgi:adenosylcobinamide kinase/adenosylcobinamide-phosphate guanylyltransferase